MISKIEEISEEIARLVIKADIPGLNDHSCHRGLFDEEYQSKILEEASGNFHGNTQSFHWEQSWGVSCRLAILWKDDTKLRDGKQKSNASPTCSISWSTTSHSIETARAALILYSAVTDLATTIQTHFRDRHIESIKDSCKRRNAEKDAVQQANLDMKRMMIGDGAIFDLIKGRTEPQIPEEFYAGLETCGAIAAVGKVCTAKAKHIVWDGEHRIGLARCGRHTKQKLTRNDPPIDN